MAKMKATRSERKRYNAGMREGENGSHTTKDDRFNVCIKKKKNWYNFGIGCCLTNKLYYKSYLEDAEKAFFINHSSREQINNETFNSNQTLLLKRILI